MIAVSAQCGELSTMANSTRPRAATTFSALSPERHISHISSMSQTFHQDLEEEDDPGMDLIRPR